MNRAIEVDRKTNRVSDYEDLVEDDCQEFKDRSTKRRSSKDVQTIGSNDFKETKRDIVVKNMQIKSNKRPQTMSSERSRNQKKTPQKIKDLYIKKQ